MNKIIKLKTTTLLIFMFATTSILASSGINLKPANTDIYDEVSLQNGAKLFMNYCSSCHSISYMRYKRMADDLNISDKQMQDNLIFTNKKIGDTITNAMDSKYSKKWFGVAPPDLSLIARSNGVDWIYNYLHGFYTDNSRPFGVNNKFLHNVAMPDVLANRKASIDAVEFDKDIRDITNFLDYVSEPIKLQRVNMGLKVILFLLVLLVLSYLLKKEYWKDVKYGKWQPRDKNVIKS